MIPTFGLKPKPMEPIGDLTPVKPGGPQYHWMRCSNGHEDLYGVAALRRSKKIGKPQRCRQCAAGDRR